MKFANKIITAIISVTISALICLLPTKAISSEENKENAACEKYEYLMNEFSMLGNKSNKYINEIKYPETYAGACYNNGVLEIFLTDTSSDTINYYINKIGENDVRYIKSIYSYNYLIDLYNFVVDAFSNREIEFNTVAIYQKENIGRISVNSILASHKLQSLLTQSGYESDSYDIIINNNRPKPTSTYARPGDRVYKWSGSTRIGHIATIGFNAKRSDGTKGFVTAEHALWSGYDLGIYEYNCSSVSNCIGSKSTDSCFVPFNSAISGGTGLISNSGLYGSSTYKITASYNSSANLEGQTLTGFGKTSGKYTGVVQATSVSFTLIGGDGTLVSDALLIRTPRLTPTGGDSGGCIVKITDSSSSPQTVTLAGILSSTVDYDDYTEAYVPKAHNILSSLNVTVLGGSN